jgi:outer membrane protein assembly factor BamD (BamD/ComL family)
MFCLSHRLPWLVTLFLTVALAALAAAPGRTQTVPPAPTPAVKVLLDQGRDALRSGKLDEALRSFEAAREPRARRRIGRARRAP